MAKRLGGFLCRKLNGNGFSQRREVSQYYPIDEHIFGLTPEQIQVNYHYI